MKTIYLSGNIAGIDAEEAVERFNRNSKILSELDLCGESIRILNPLRGKIVYPRVDGTASKTGSTFAYYEPNEITHRDLWDIMSADIVVADITNSSLGVGAELGVAWYLRKPIVVVTDNADVREHPFIQTFALKIVNTIGEARDFLLDWML